VEPFQCTGCEFDSSDAIVLNAPTTAVFASTIFSSLYDVTIQPGVSVDFENCLIQNSTISSAFDEIVADSSSTTTSFTVQGAVIQSDEPTLYIANSKVSIESSLATFWNGSATSFITSIGMCSNSTFTTNLNVGASTCGGNILVTPYNLANGSSVLIPYEPTQSVSYYYLWENSGLWSSVTVSIATTPTNNSYNPNIAIAIVSSELGVLPTITNAPYVTYLKHQTGSSNNWVGTITLSAVDNTLGKETSYIIAMIVLPSINKDASTVISQATLSIQAQPNYLDVSRIAVNQIPKIAFAGDKVVINVTLLDIWGDLFEVEEDVLLQYAENPGFKISTSGLYAVSAPASTEWNPWLHLPIYVTAGNKVATGTGLILKEFLYLRESERSSDLILIL